MMITPLQLKKVFPVCHDPNAWCRIFTMELPAFEITTAPRLAAWIAQCGYVSQGFNTIRESGAYGRKYQTAAGATAYNVFTEKRLMELWPNKFPTVESAAPYIQQPERLLSYVYANMLGNGDVASRDGFIYRGGGLIQLTGRANYREAGKALGLKLEAMPKMIEQPAIAVRTSGLFWKLHDLNTAADAGDFDYITKKITGSMTAADERLSYYKAALAQMALSPSFVKGAAPGPATPHIGPNATGPGTLPGPVVPGTLDGLHTPGNNREVMQTKYGKPGDFEQPRHG